jgi:uncharacterized repeat protein (TIGR03803 family)
VFKMTATGELSTLVSFSRTNGDGPGELTLGKDACFYGTTEYGSDLYDGSDAVGCGTVFKICTNGTLTTLVSFSGPNGKFANGLVLGRDGTFYGTTSEGGALNKGTIFRVTPNGTLTTLYSFTEGGEDGIVHASLTQGTDGNFYGTIASGGKYHCGSIFRLTVTPPSPR